MATTAFLRNGAYAGSNNPYLNKTRPEIDPTMWGTGGKKGELSNERYAQEADQALFDAGSEAFRLRDLEEARGRAGEATMTSAFEKASKPTLTDKDIRQYYSRAADESGQAYLDNMAGLRGFLGQGGISPDSGLGQGLASDYNLARSLANVKSRSDLTIQKIVSDAADRQRNFQNAGALAQVQMRPVAMQGSDFLNDLAGIRLGQQGLATEMDVARNQAKAAKQAGKQAGVGSLIGGGLNLVGSIFGL